MGRFATTAALYEQFRPLYSPEFFRAVVERLRLGKQHALIDLGTGPGLLALGFARMSDGSSVWIQSRPCLRSQDGRPIAQDMTLR